MTTILTRLSNDEIEIKTTEETITVNKKEDLLNRKIQLQTIIDDIDAQLLVIGSPVEVIKLPML